MKGASCNWWQQRGILNPNGSYGWQVELVIIGFLLTILALTPGAQFWFGLLVKLGVNGAPPRLYVCRYVASPRSRAANTSATILPPTGPSLMGMSFRAVPGVAFSHDVTCASDRM